MNEPINVNESDLQEASGGASINPHNVVYKCCIVRKGETLDEIARRNGTTVEALRKANNLKKDTGALAEGSQLLIPGV